MLPICEKVADGNPLTNSCVYKDNDFYVILALTSNFSGILLLPSEIPDYDATCTRLNI